MDLLRFFLAPSLPRHLILSDNLCYNSIVGWSSNRCAPHALRFLTLSGFNGVYVMSNFNLSAAVQSELSDIATKSGAVFATAERGWKPLVKRFRAVVDEMGVVDRKSDGGKAVDAFMTPLIVAALVKSGHYDVAVHRVGSGDEYLPVDKEHPANFTITGAYAVSAERTAERQGLASRHEGLAPWQCRERSAA